jgi:hypothetical protein
VNFSVGRRQTVILNSCYCVKHSNSYFKTVLTMVYNTQNYRVWGLFPSSGILENMTFRKLDLFPSSGEGGGENTYSVGPLRKS